MEEPTATREKVTIKLEENKSSEWIDGFEMGFETGRRQTQLYLLLFAFGAIFAMLLLNYTTE